MDEEMQTLLAQAHERLKNRNLSDIDALQKEEVENSVNLVYGEKKSLALAFFETDDKEDKKRKLDEQNLLQATRFAVERMQELPISSRLLKDVHWVMMQGEHNERKYPGEVFFTAIELTPNPNERFGFNFIFFIIVKFLPNLSSMSADIPSART